ncbi:S-layer homology domain-containing protein [Ructibacterium gallinarum]|uniref:S-layer homology domain-containing protein n=1 Tax=Ructibacterium gallinarum TaxID=2779355 RepID=A0A9D5M0C2_9FIRM|nr:S-layer homology domain-containing protein [Ructibacterium gallinarum]MBE5039930.1 S-layer homology domain-containing protein [Ructibacterium gallinarum]
MKKHRILSCAVCLSMALSTLSASVFALSFNDVDNDPTVAWAKDSITQMTEAGYIKGYEEGTFKPYRAISKIECLLLMSRMLGVEEEEYADFTANAKAMYGTTVAKYNTTYPDELCFLLYMGILTESDLVDYASTANANTELLRYQAAMLMAKLMGADSEAKAFSVSPATYADDAKIPSSAKPYVEYVTEEGIMNGMDKDANGNPQFSPTTSLTRAQMATLLARMIDKLDKMTYTGTIDTLDLNNDVIAIDRNGDVSERNVNDDTVARQDGKSIQLNTLAEGSEIAAVEINGHIQLIEVVSEGSGSVSDKKGTVVYALISSLTESADGQRITLADSEDSSNNATYTAASNCTYTINGTKGNFSSLKKNDFVKATISGGKIVAISVEDTDLTISGTLTEVEFDEDDHVYLYVEDSEGDEQQYVVSSKGATVTRDGSSAEYRELSAGDKVTMELYKGKITKVKATSSTESFTGVLSEIVIATQPSVTILIDGKAENFKLRSDARILISGEEATIYDLRPNITVSGTLDSSEIRTLMASSVSTNEKGEVTGTVTGINTSYKVITVEDSNGNSQSIYYNTKTTFLKSSGDTTTAKSIEKGATVSITGAENNGIFEATIIIVK